MSDKQQKWLVISTDDDYREPCGIFEGNMFDILNKYFTIQLPHEATQTTYSFYLMDDLEQKAINRKAESDGMKRLALSMEVRNIDIGEVCGHHISGKSNQSLIKSQLKEFQSQNPNTQVKITKDGTVSFESIDSKIKKELSSLSPETIEYIRKNGF